jgi:hypothetical protein
MSDNNVRIVSYTPTEPSLTVTMQSGTRMPATKNFVRSSIGTDVLLAFGATVPDVLREMANGLEAEGISAVDGVSLHYELDFDLPEDTYCLTAYVYPKPEET